MALEPQKILVGVDGPDASIVALRVARTLAEPLKASMEAWACWDVPPGYGIYLAVGTEGFKHATKEVLEQSLEAAFGGDRPEYLRGRLVPGSVSSACVSHAHCPVLVVHSPQNRGGGQ
jgi:nucleotide-binding universal stress UspA family protein